MTIADCWLHGRFCCFDSRGTVSLLEAELHASPAAAQSPTHGRHVAIFNFIFWQLYRCHALPRRYLACSDVTRVSHPVKPADILFSPEKVQVTWGHESFGGVPVAALIGSRVPCPNLGSFAPRIAAKSKPSLVAEELPLDMYWSSGAALVSIPELCLLILEVEFR